MGNNALPVEEPLPEGFGPLSSYDAWLDLMYRDMATELDFMFQEYEQTQLTVSWWRL
jgi:hypothetical protein